MTSDPKTAQQARAAIWVQRLEKGELTESQFGELEAWLRKSEGNREAFKAAQDVWSSVSVSKRELDEILSLEFAGFRKTSSRMWRQRIFDDLALASSKWATLSVSAVSIVCVLFVMVFVNSEFDAPEKADFVTDQTVIGASEIVQLQDGSAIELNTATEVRHRYTSTEREVHLLSGEAYFSVTPDESAPFRVNVDGHKISVVGTSFNVKFLNEHFTLIVVEGVVELLPNGRLRTLRLAEGESVSITADGELSEAKLGAPLALAWRQGAVAFENMTLTEILKELDRYFEQDLSFDSDTVPDLYSGIIFIDDLTTALEQLSTLSGVEILFQPNEGVSVK